MAEGEQRVIEVQEKFDVKLENQNLLKSLITTPPIHAGVLYTKEGKELNQTLCLLLSGTKRSTYYSNWEDFAFSIGLTSQIIQCIKHNLVQQDPTTYVLLAYVQYDNPTLQKILEALFDIERYDILKQIEPLVQIINKEITPAHEIEILKTLKTLKSPFVLTNLKNKQHGQELDISSLILTILEGLMKNNDLIKNVQKYVALETSPAGKEIFHKCEVENLQRSSMVKNVQKYVALETSPVEKEIFHKCEVENLQRSSIATAPPARNEKTYDVTIFLTYTSDASDIAETLVKTLRAPRNGVRIGVLVLNEHFFRVNQSPEQFIFDCFAQVDYVFPIITKDYLSEVTGKAANQILSPIQNLDHKYVQYIYNLMMTQYVKNRCKNRTVCCIIPDNIIHDVRHHPLMNNHSLFQIWVPLNNIDMLIKSILKQKKIS